MAGLDGMLGEAFHNVFGPRHELKCTDIDVNADWLSHLDFRDFDAYCAVNLTLRGLNIMRDWRVCLDEYLAEHYAGYLPALKVNA